MEAGEGVVTFVVEDAGTRVLEVRDGRGGVAGIDRNGIMPEASVYFSHGVFSQSNANSYLFWTNIFNRLLHSDASTLAGEIERLSS